MHLGTLTFSSVWLFQSIFFLKVSFCIEFLAYLKRLKWGFILTFNVYVFTLFDYLLINVVTFLRDFLVILKYLLQNCKDVFKRCFLGIICIVIWLAWSHFLLLTSVLRVYFYSFSPFFPTHLSLSSFLLSLKSSTSLLFIVTLRCPLLLQWQSPCVQKQQLWN